MPVCKFSRESHESIEIVAFLDQLTEVLYTLWEVLDSHKKNLTIPIKCNGFDYTKGVLTIKLRTILEGDDISSKTILEDAGVYKCLKPLIQVALLNEWHRYEAFSQRATF